MNNSTTTTDPDSPPRFRSSFVHQTPVSNSMNGTNPITSSSSTLEDRRGTSHYLLHNPPLPSSSSSASSSAQNHSHHHHHHHRHRDSNSLYDTDTTLSTFLANLLSSFNSFLTSPSSSFPSSSSSLRIPDAPMIGFIALCTLWYISSALSSNTGKAILTRFRYPVTLTFVQFAFVAGYSVLFLAVRERFNSRGSGSGSRKGGAGGISSNAAAAAGGGVWSVVARAGIRMPSKGMLKGTFVMSLFQISGHVFSSMAIARVPVSTVHTIKALSPLFTVVSYAALFRIRYSTSTYTALLPLTLGVMLACSFDLRANAVGFLCALGSTFIFVSQNIFSKKLLPKEGASGASLTGTSSGSGGRDGSGAGGGGKLDKLNLLFYSSGMAFVLMIPIWLYSDSTALFSTSSAIAAVNKPTMTTSTTGLHSLLFYFVLNGSVHFAQNLLAFSILAKTSPVTYSIASLVKRIAVICLAIIWSGQQVSLIQGCGMAMTFFGLWLYNRARGDVEKGERKRGLIEKKEALNGFLPTTTEEARMLTGGMSTPPPLPAIHRPSYFTTDPDPPPLDPPATFGQQRYQQQQQQQQYDPPPSSTLPPPHPLRSHHVPPPPPSSSHRQQQHHIQEQQSHPTSTDHHSPPLPLPISAPLSSSSSTLLSPSQSSSTMSPSLSTNSHPSPYQSAAMGRNSSIPRNRSNSMTKIPGGGTARNGGFAVTAGGGGGGGGGEGNFNGI